MALLHLMESPPDLCISGINLGPNLGDDVHYSGTVGGAMEARLHGVKSIAISLVTHTDPIWDGAAKFCVDFAPRMLELELPRDTFLNVNVPNLPLHELRGSRVTSQGSRRYKGDLTRHSAPNIGDYYWRGGEVIDRAESSDADVLIIKDGFISVTPIHVDLTRRDAMERVELALRGI
jgi:5'-nucleotidase